MYVNRDVTEMQLNAQLQPLLGDYLSFIISETIKNATECVRNSYISGVILVLLAFPPGKHKRAPAFVLGHLTSLTHPYSSSSYMEIRIR